jgi:hypothetical protein
MIPLGTSPDTRASELLESAPPRFSTLAEMTIEETFTMSPTNALYRLSGAGPLAQAERDTASPMLSQEQANEKYGVADLRFDGPVNERTAQLLWTEKRAEMLRKETLARGPDGFWNATNWGLFGVGLATSAVDPVSLVAGVLTGGAFTAFRGGHAALSAARAVGQQSFARSVALGAAEGAIGAALVEPLVYAMADDYSIDYGVSDSLMNIAAGAAGGALFTGLGIAIDRFRRPSMQASDAALSMAVAQMEAGKPVRVEPILRRDEPPPAPTQAPEPEPPPQPPAAPEPFILNDPAPPDEPPVPQGPFTETFDVDGNSVTLTRPDIYSDWEVQGVQLAGDAPEIAPGEPFMTKAKKKIGDTIVTLERKTPTEQWSIKDTQFTGGRPERPDSQNAAPATESQNLGFEENLTEAGIANETRKIQQAAENDAEALKSMVSPDSDTAIPQSVKESPPETLFPDTADRFETAEDAKVRADEAVALLRESSVNPESIDASLAAADEEIAQAEAIARAYRAAANCGI